MVSFLVRATALRGVGAAVAGAFSFDPRWGSAWEIARQGNCRMSESDRFIASAVCFAASVFTASLSTTSQAVECFPGPEFQPPTGTRWQYRMDSATNKGCWYVEGLDGSGHRAAKTPASPSRPSAVSALSKKTTNVAAPQADRRDLTSALKDWFSPKVPGATDLPDAYLDTRQDAVRNPALVRKRTNNKASPGKTEQPNKTAEGKPSGEQAKSGRTQDRYSISATGLLEAAGDKPVPGLPALAPSDLKTALEAVGDKDVVAAPAEPKEDWQQALYEEFLRWRLRQILHEKARRMRRELDTADH
jgi:hypothetical protein